MSGYGDIDGSSSLSSGEVWFIMKSFLLLQVINAVILRMLHALVKIEKEKQQLYSVKGFTCSVICA